MFSLSTCWFGSRPASGEALADEAVSLGFGAIELGYALKAAWVPGIMDRVRSGALAISSVHAFCPAPDGAPGHPELFSPAATSEKARGEAVAKVLETLAFAGEVGAPIVVLHAGRVAGASRLWPKVHAGIMEEADGFFHRFRLRRMVSAREAGAPAAMESLRRSLSELLPAFERAGVRLALENLPSYDALPSPEEMDALAAEFGSSPAFGFWFDMGHGQVMENAGYGDAAALARRHLKLLAGVHVHDVIGPGGDHQAPGLGGIDYGRFAFLSALPNVFEPLSDIPADELRGAVAFMERAWPAHASGR